MEKKIVAFDELCSGCRSCQMWCSFTHKQVFGRSNSRIQIISDIMDDRWDIPLVDCTAEKCPLNEKGEPICVEMCPTGCLVYTDSIDAFQKRKELTESRDVQPLFKLIAPWKWSYPWKPWAGSGKGGM